MFKCGNCDSQSGHGEVPTRVVTQVRKRGYDYGFKVTYGTEIVKELQVCRACKAKMPEEPTVLPDVVMSKEEVFVPDDDQV